MAQQALDCSHLCLRWSATTPHRPLLPCPPPATLNLGQGSSQKKFLASASQGLRVLITFPGQASAASQTPPPSLRSQHTLKTNTANFGSWSCKIHEQSFMCVAVRSAFACTHPVRINVGSIPSCWTMSFTMFFVAIQSLDSGRGVLEIESW